MTSSTAKERPTALDVLTRLRACPSGIQEVREAGSLATAWESTSSLRNMVWLLGALHVDGRMTRQRLVRVCVRLAETCAHLAPPACLPLLADVSAWADGDDTVDLVATRAALWEAQGAAWGRRFDAAAYAANAAAVAYDAAYAAFAAAFAAALCAVLRDEVSGAEVAEAMGVDLGEVFGEAGHAG